MLQRNASCRENLYGENAGGATSVSLAAPFTAPGGLGRAYPEAELLPPAAVLELVVHNLAVDDGHDRADIHDLLVGDL